ncbi:MAG: arsenic efflux protein [Clostridia bacterium]|nr:arsenic efflux protein [Clostridia bacterium]
MTQFLEILHHSFADTVKLILPLFLVYFLIEYLEKYRQSAFLKRLGNKNAAAPLWGALFGCIPQCGFSGIAAELYSHRFITVGTLFAVFIATGDEALPMLISSVASRPDAALTAVMLIAVKLVFAFIFGTVIDLAAKKLSHHRHEHKCEHYHDAGECSEDADCGNRHGECGCHHDGQEKGFLKGILFPSLKHTAKISLFIFAVNFLLTAVMHLLGGEEEMARLLSGAEGLTPLLAALFGLIPNCAVSVLLTDLYLDGAISFAAVCAGLSSGAGIGLFVLFKSNKSLKENVIISLILFLAGTAIGYAVHGLSLLF